jgi:uncharacterized protein (DUF1330 family)
MNVDVDYRQRCERYRLEGPAMFERHGGRPRAHGRELHPVDGGIGFEQLMVLEFCSMERCGASTPARGTRRPRRARRGA